MSGKIPNIPKEIEDNILGHVKGDLSPSWWLVFTKSGASIILGGMISMIFCGQFGLGLTGHAEQMNHAIHMNAGGVVCAMACGALFSFFPVFFLRMFCSPLQFRLILRKKSFYPAMWIALVGTPLSHYGDFGGDMFMLSIWFVTAWAFYLAMGWVLHMSGKVLLPIRS